MKDGKGPRTVLELQERFPDEAACMAFLREVRWPHSRSGASPRRAWIRAVRERINGCACPSDSAV